MKLYTKEQFLLAAEIGEVSMIDARHIVSLLDEAVAKQKEQPKEYNHQPQNKNEVPCDHYWIRLRGRYWCRKCCVFNNEL